MSDYICKDEKGKNYVLTNGFSEGHISMYTGGYHYEYNCRTKRYYKLEESVSLRKDCEGKLIRKRISKEMFYKIMEHIKDICKKEEEEIEKNRVYKNGMIIKCRNIARGELIKCKIINIDYDYDHVEVKILEYFKGHAIVEKDDMVFINQFMDNEGKFTYLEKKQIVIKSIFDRIVKNFLNAEFNNETKLMSYYSKKLYNVLKKYEYGLLYRETRWTKALLEDISLFYINENIKIDTKSEGLKTRNWEYVVENYTYFKSKMQLIMNYKCPRYFAPILLNESKVGKNGCIISCRECWDLEIEKGYMLCGICGESGVYKLEEHNCPYCKERGLIKIDQSAFEKTINK